MESSRHLPRRPGVAQREGTTRKRTAAGEDVPRQAGHLRGDACERVGQMLRLRQGTVAPLRVCPDALRPGHAWGDAPSHEAGDDPTRGDRMRRSAVPGTGATPMREGRWP